MQTVYDKVWIVLQLQIYVVYLVSLWIYQRLTMAVRVLNGTAEIPVGKVRMMSIIWRHKVEPEEFRRNDFVLGSGHFESSELLNDPHWALYVIEKDYVLFVLLPEPVYNYNISEHPFIYVPMFERALAVAEMKRTEFLNFAKRLSGEPQPSTVFYTNTARCGSTLLGRMLHRPGVSVCYGEPPALTMLSTAIGEGFMSETEVRELLRATITCLRAHLPRGVICILKTQSFEARLVPLCEGIPNLKHIFMFRKKALLSVEKVVKREEFLVMLLLELYKISPPLTYMLSTTTARDGKWVRLLNPKGARALAAILLASPMAEYQKNKKMYCHPIIWYHEVINDTDRVLTSLFNEIGIPLSCLPDAIACKGTDSQQGSFLSSQKLTHIKFEPISSSDRAMLQDYAKKMKVPEEVFEVDE